MATCFVIMPFGEKEGIDFDLILQRIIRPPVEALGIDCVRCDEIEMAGDIHQDMIEHIANDEVAVVDITTLNANVFYELGVRHALRSGVTIMLRRRGTPSPFNLAGARAIDYDETDEQSVAETQEKIKRFIANGQASSDSDSPVHDDLPNLSVSIQSPRLPAGIEARFSLSAAPGKEIRLVTGDIRTIKGIDVWVNSENTNMQMARFFDRSMSGIIRYCGATKNPIGHVVKDVVADELRSLMDEWNAQTVPPGTVIATASGELAQTHGVKRIYHAASVTGQIGQGYAPIQQVGSCVTNALALCDSEQESEHAVSSILFPIMGSGTAKSNPRAAADELLAATGSYLQATPDSRVACVSFLISRAPTLGVWEAALAKLGQKISADADGDWNSSPIER